MKKLLIALSFSIFALIIASILYLKSLENKTPTYPPNIENSIATLHVPDIQPSLKRFCDTTIYNSLSNPTFSQFIELTKSLIKTQYAIKNFDLTTSTYVSLYLNEPQNTIEYAIYFTKNSSHPPHSTHPKDRKIQDIDLISIPSNPQNYKIYSTEIDNYIVLSPSKTLLEKIHRSSKPKTSPIKKYAPPSDHYLIINRDLFINYLNTKYPSPETLEITELIPTNSQQYLYASTKITDKCASITIYFENKHLEPTTNNNPKSKPFLPKYCTNNTTYIKFIHTQNLTTLLKQHSQQNHTKNLEDEPLIKTISSLTAGTIACLHLDTNYESEPSMIGILHINDTENLKNILIQENCISTTTNTKYQIRPLAQSPLNNHIFKNLFPKFEPRYITILHDCIALSNTIQALISWYDHCLQGDTYKKATSTLSYTPNIGYLINLSNPQTPNHTQLKDIFPGIEIVSIQIDTHTKGSSAIFFTLYC